MSKGFFTQGVAVLLKQKVTLDDIEPLLKAFKIVKRKDVFEHWEFGGPTFVIEYRPEVNGLVSVDIVERPWPDDMGDPKSELTMFGAWSMGHFGPFTFPGSFERARQQCHTWKDGARASAEHQSFIRIRTSYAFGLPENSPVMPKDCNPIDELNFITRIAVELLRHPQAICYFNPNGELLVEPGRMEKVLEHYRKVNLPPVDLWMNRRMYKFNDNWMLMDTVGLKQLDLEDLETCYQTGRYDPNDIVLFLGNTALYLAGTGPVIKDGETIDGPKETRFRAKHFPDGKVTPPRETLRFHPVDGTVPPPDFGFDPMETKKKWQFWK